MNDSRCFEERRERTLKLEEESEIERQTLRKKCEEELQSSRKEWKKWVNKRQKVQVGSLPHIVYKHRVLQLNDISPSNQQACFNKVVFYQQPAHLVTLNCENLASNAGIK